MKEATDDSVKNKPSTALVVRDAAVLSPDENISRYLSDIRKFPMLSEDEEFMLAKRWQEYGDEKAAHRLVTSHLRFVAKIAMRYKGYGLPLADLVSEGNVGLMKAVKKYDPDKGFRLATYAMWWIKASIHEYVLQSWSLVKIGTTVAQKKLFFGLRRIKSRLQSIEAGGFSEKDLSPEHVNDIAEELNVSAQDVVMMNQRLSGGDYSLNAPLDNNDGDDGISEWQDKLADDRATPEDALMHQNELEYQNRILQDGMTVLNDRERKIIEARRLNEKPKTLEELSAEFGITRERVRQIEVKAFEKLQKYFLEQMPTATTA